MQIKQKNPIKAFRVLLGVDRAARPTGGTLELVVLAKSKLDAAIEAERLGDRLVPDTDVMYTVCKHVNEISNNKTLAVAQAA